MLNSETQERSQQRKHHEMICSTIHRLFLERNNTYGNAFHNLYEELGLPAGVTQISNKYHRALTMTKQSMDGMHHGEEFYANLIDTLYDLANYSILTIMELEDIHGGKTKEVLKDDRSIDRMEKSEKLTDEELNNLLRTLSPEEVGDKFYKEIIDLQKKNKRDRELGNVTLQDK